MDEIRAWIHCANTKLLGAIFIVITNPSYVNNRCVSVISFDRDRILTDVSTEHHYNSRDVFRNGQTSTPTGANCMWHLRPTPIDVLTKPICKTKITVLALRLY